MDNASRCSSGLPSRLLGHKIDFVHHDKWHSRSNLIAQGRQVWFRADWPSHIDHAEGSGDSFVNQRHTVVTNYQMHSAEVDGTTPQQVGSRGNESVFRVGKQAHAASSSGAPS